MDATTNPLELSELLTLVLSFVNPYDTLKNCALVSHFWNQCSNEELLWKQYCDKESVSYTDQNTGDASFSFKQALREATTYRWHDSCNHCDNLVMSKNNRVAQAVKAAIFQTLCSQQQYTTGCHYFEIENTNTTNEFLFGLARFLPPTKKSHLNKTGSYMVWPCTVMYTNSNPTTLSDYLDEATYTAQSQCSPRHVYGIFADFNRGYMWIYKDHKCGSVKGYKIDTSQPLHLAVDFSNGDDIITYVSHSISPPEYPPDFATIE